MPRRSEPILRVVRADGSVCWQVNLSLTRKGTRKRFSKVVETRAEALELLATHRLQQPVVKRRREDFDDAADRYLEQVRRSSARPKTVSDYEYELRRPRAALGPIRVQDLDADDIERIVDAMVAEGLKKGTVGRMLTRVRAVLALAVDDGLLTRNVAAKVKARGATDGQRDSMTVGEVGTVRQAMRGDRYEGCWLLTLAGTRRGELLALRWTDIDFTAGTVAITRSRTTHGEGPTKTAAGMRTIVPRAETIELLRELRSWQAETYGLAQARDGHVVVNEAGRPMRPEDWTGRWKALCEAAGVPGHVLHAARHTSVTLMRNAGVPDHVVAKHHGHDEVVMARTYSHAKVDDLRRAAEALPY